MPFLVFDIWAQQIVFLNKGKNDRPGLSMAKNEILSVFKQKLWQRTNTSIYSQ